MMRNFWMALGIVAVAMAMGLEAYSDEDSASAAQGQSLVSALGVGHVQGKDVLVHVSLVVSADADASEQAVVALQARGARPFRSSDYVLLGPSWQSDPLAGHPQVTQYYNSAGAPSGNFLAEMQAAQATWTNVTGSSFEMTDGGPSTRCGSLIAECPGPQVFDGFQDIGWNDLGRCIPVSCTLAVTWFGDADGDGFMDDADVAFNTRISPWATGCSSDYSTRTVAIHEFGHVAGLNHSSVSGAIMEAYYGGANCTLHPDDEAGLIALYSGAGNPAPTLVSISITPQDGSIEAGETQQYAAQGTYSDSPSADITDLVTWSSSDNGVATIDAFGLATGEGPGDVIITATLNGVSSNGAALSVTAAASPPPLGGEANVDSCDPFEGTRGQQMIVTVSGTGFVDGASVSFGDRVMVQSVNVVSDSLIEVQIKVHPRAAFGARDVVVTNPGASASTDGEACFNVIP
jgi:hypothetical protein